MNKTTRIELEAKHRLYGDFNQKERKDVRLMADTGHPQVKAYLTLRRFFDGLKYACNSAARLFSYESMVEQSQYWAPELKVTWEPGGFDGFWHVYPAMGDEWMRYLTAAAQAGYPKEVQPRFDAGQWIVHTQDGRLYRALCEVAAQYGMYITKHITTLADQEFWDVSIREMTPAGHRKVAAILRQYHKGAILPKRTAEDVARDTEALPLSDRHLSPANVKEVTVTDRKVLVPLVPLGPAGLPVIERTVNQLVNLLEKGYPFKQVEWWLDGAILPAKLHQLKQKYTAALATA